MARARFIPGEDEDEVAVAGRPLRELVSRLNVDTLDVEDPPEPEVAMGEPVEVTPEEPPAPPQRPAAQGMDLSELEPYAPTGPVRTSAPPLIQAPGGRAPSRVDQVRRALTDDADNRRNQGVSDAIYSAASRRPLAPMAQGASAMQGQAALDDAQGEDAKGRRAAEMQDPNSEVSKLARQRFLGLDLGKKFAANMGPQYEQLPASMVPGVDKLLEAEGRIDPSKALQRGTNAKALEMRGVKVQEDKDHAKAYLQSVLDDNLSTPGAKKLASKLLQADLSFDVAKASMGPALTDAQKERDYGRGVKMESVRDTYDQKKEGRTEARTAVEREVALPDGSRAQAGTVPEAAKLRAVKGDVDYMVSAVDKLSALIDKHGVEVMPGQAKADMEAILTDLQLKMKGPGGYELGVLAGPDMGLLEKASGDPTKLGALFGGAAGVKTRLRRLKENLQGSYGSKVKAVSRSGSEGPGAGRIVVTNGTETLRIDAADLAEALKAGYRRANE